MFIVCVTIFVNPGDEANFIAATRENFRGTRQEPANVRFDFSQAVDDPTRFFLYEVYKEKDGFTKHQQTAHYQKWKEAVGLMMREPRVGVKHTALFFGDAEG
jgi:(4S)-4-hydroxy-5-phosphonooxypentane-2,3-dione isomerase